MKKEVNLFLIVVLFVSLVSASFEIGDLSHSIDLSYGPEENIRGWANVSLDDESVDSMFEDSQSNSISLIHLIKLNDDFDYSCTPLDCESDYSASNSQTTKTFSLASGGSKILGFKFTGMVSSINSIDFTLTSNAQKSCYNQLDIDVLNDREIDFGNNKTSTTMCDSLKDYTCFDSGKSLSDFFVGATKYCQKIRLSQSPGFKIGAWVKKIGSSGELTMTLYNNAGEKATNCKLLSASTSGSEISCSIDYLVAKSEEYYVCISSDEENQYKIRGYQDANGCGFYGNPVKAENAAYQIFAQGKKFNSIGELEITNSLQSGESFAGLVLGHLRERYGSGIDCSDGCIVPIKFSARESQDITIRELSIKYISGGGSTDETNFYDLAEISAKVTADFQKLFLDEGNFSVPSDYGNSTFKLKLSGDEVFSETISVEEVPTIKRLIPMTTISAFPTPFKVKVNSTTNITKYLWEFGDGKNETTTNNEVIHLYNSTGTYNLKITITDLNQLTSYKTFSVEVGSPKKVINSTINKMQNDLGNVKLQISNLNSFEQSRLNSLFKLEDMENDLKEVQREYAKALSEEDYNKIMTDLLDLKIPESVDLSTSAKSITFYPEKENIDLGVLATVGGGYYKVDEEDEYINAVLLWNQENLNTRVTFKLFSAMYNEEVESVLRTFELNIDEKQSLREDPYLIIKDLEGLEFKESYLETPESGYFYIELTRLPETIVFSTTEDVNFISLPAFISPSIERLSIDTEDDTDEEEEGPFRWGLFLLVIILLLIVGVVVYRFLQQKNKYKLKSNLFQSNKPKDNLFQNKSHSNNLTNYIDNSRKRKVPDHEIEKKLRKIGWKSDQIKSSMKKGPGFFDKILSMFKRKKEEPKVLDLTKR